MTRLAALALVALLGVPANLLADAPPPKLVVVIVVDQMRRDYVDDYGSHWTRGLRRIFDQGAWFTEAAYPYLTTLTCPGHATISTGTLPSTHGIINNQWWDRESQQLISCSSDQTVQELPFDGNRQRGTGASGRLLNAPSFASALSDATHGQGRVVTMSVKRASATMLAGQKGDVVLWLQGGGFSSSTAYATEPEKSLARYLNDHPILQDFGKPWGRLGKSGDYKYVDDGVAEKPPMEWDAKMPHMLQPRSGKPTTFFYEAWDESPYADAYVGRLATAAVDGMKLGRGPATDYLGISFSALDVVGHDFGPRSHEIQDVLMRLDQTLGDLLDDLDKKVGRDNYVVAFSADHGVATIPEQLTAETKDAGRLKMTDLMTLADAIVSKKFGPGRWVAIEAYTEFYFRRGVFDRIAADPELLGEVIRGLASQPGVQEVIDGRKLAAQPDPASPDSAAVAAARKSYVPGRSGDLLVIQKPNWIFVSDDKTLIPGNATTHGSPYPYDQRVPLVFLGGHIAKGHFDEACSPADIAPTLARITGVPLPTATGQVLKEALPQQ
jgi:predicted AlkP superfamily pyrophosphatase or phosphodiesterase